MANAGIYYGRPSTTHKIDFTASSVTQTTAFGSDTSYVMLCAKTAGCHFHLASSPTATLQAPTVFVYNASEPIAIL